MQTIAQRTTLAHWEWKSLPLGAEITSTRCRLVGSGGRLQLSSPRPDIPRRTWSEAASPRTVTFPCNRQALHWTQFMMLSKSPATHGTIHSLGNTVDPRCPRNSQGLADAIDDASAHEFAFAASTQRNWVTRRASSGWKQRISRPRHGQEPTM